jgi:hypothetical protein
MSMASCAFADPVVIATTMTANSLFLFIDCKMMCRNLSAKVQKKWLSVVENRIQE